MFWHCSQCNSQVIPFITDNIAELKKLKNFGEWKPEYNKYEHVCNKCWKTIISKDCSLCRNKFSVLSDRRADLYANLNYHEKDLAKFLDKKHICSTCFNQNSFATCCRCEKSTPAAQNQAKDYSQNQDTRRWLLPCHPEAANDLKYASEMLCISCNKEIQNEASKVSERYNNWTGGTKGEFLRGYQIKKEMGRIKTEETWQDPAAVQMCLKLFAAQVGGNGYIKFFLERHQRRYAQKYIAGYGPKGNPYYETEYSNIVWYTGSAIAIWAERQIQKNKTKIDLPLEQKRRNWRQN